MREPPPAPQHKWTESERLAVKAMLAKGATAAMVAAQMHISRNAALGRIYRDKELSLTTHKGSRSTPLTCLASTVRQMKSAKARPRPVAASLPSPVKREHKSSAGDKPPPETVSDQQPFSMGAVEPVPVKSVPQHMPLIGTGNTFCKWPVAIDKSMPGGIACCGAPIPRFAIYCDEHHMMARGNG